MKSFIDLFHIAKRLCTPAFALVLGCSAASTAQTPNPAQPKTGGGSLDKSVSMDDIRKAVDVAVTERFAKEFTSTDWKKHFDDSKIPVVDPTKGQRPAGSLGPFWNAESVALLPGAVTSMSNAQMAALYAKISSLEASVAALQQQIQKRDEIIAVQDKVIAKLKAEAEKK